MTYHIAYLGNFGPPHSTENHVARAFTKQGHVIYAMQEDNPAWWDMLRDWATAGAWPVDMAEPDFVLRTRTWERPEFQAEATYAALKAAGVPTVGFHLDRWWGLSREHEVADQSFFMSDLLITADGGHDDRWADYGIRHVWLPPGVSELECLRKPNPRHDLDGKIIFVGSWQGYHQEWPWRMQLIRWLQTSYGDQFVAFPQSGQPAVRGQELVDLYAADAVFVGDSCLAGGATRYWSDRVSETLGRRGFLVHPRVEGMDEHYTDGEHYSGFDVGDLDDLARAIDTAVADPALRERVRAAGQQHVLAHHTYEVRVGQILAACAELPNWGTR